MRYTDYKLEDRFYFDQKVIPNSDGSSNMVWTETWRRFNYCFIASSTAALNQAILRMRKKGKTPIGSFRTSYIDPVAYKSVMLSRLNDGNAWKDNSGRYLWENHESLTTTLLNNSFEKPVGQFKFQKYNRKKIIESLKNGYQVVMGINIRHHYGTGGGHVICVTGWREDDDTEEFMGFWVNDPAGNLIGPKSYRNNSISGEDVFYPVKELRHMISGRNHMMYLEET